MTIDNKIEEDNRILPIYKSYKHLLQPNFNITDILVFAIRSYLIRCQSSREQLSLYLEFGYYP